MVLVLVLLLLWAADNRHGLCSSCGLWLLHAQAVENAAAVLCSVPQVNMYLLEP
jgi:hypothetical protein